MDKKYDVLIQFGTISRYPVSKLAITVELKI